ncbi:PTS sugar transporter subunit IIB [Lentibacillus sp. L22]|uniref:PTS sugar transporter subunit IIB n=1 Tax=Lentibacillus TaxID=175304 RepID=UPI0022B16BA0|nr:PTS sugar transporter subunit IIB [Lentibacillus daqui]
MKKLLIMCGTGIATSTMVGEKVKAWLREQELESEVNIYQSSVSEGFGRMKEYDIVVSTTIVPNEIKDRVIDGIPLLTGIGTEEVYQKLLRIVIQE